LGSEATVTSALLAPTTSHTLDSTQAAVQAAHASRRIAIFDSHASTSGSSSRSLSNPGDATNSSPVMDTSLSFSSSSSSSSDKRGKQSREQAPVDPVNAFVAPENASFLNGQLVNDYLELAAADMVRTALRLLRGSMKSNLI